MDHLTHTGVRRLMKTTSQVCVSIYLPTHQAAVVEMREDSLRLKNLLVQAHSQLPHTLSAGFQDGWKAAKRLLHDEDFWKHQSQGLALFISDDGLVTYRLPVAFAENVYVDQHFYATPLLDHIYHDRHFYVLALTRGSVRLWEGSQERLDDITPAAMPKNMGEALWYFESEKLLQNRSVAGVGSYHGEGEDTQEPNGRLREYLLKVNKVTADCLKQQHDPLVLCGIQPAVGLFAKLNSYAPTAGCVELNPDSLSPTELHHKVLMLLGDPQRAPYREALNAFGHYAAREPQRTETDPEKIIAAAHIGRVEALLVAKPQPEAGAMAFHEQLPAESDDDAGGEAFRPSLQTETAVRETYLTSGEVYLVPDEVMPAGTVMAAIMRY